ncbi:flagellar biosynthesis protein FlhF, partial [Kinneretia asaccharophila]|nr:flagellar biosynthesis protein FlhF [Roseateles asaccharophilus]
MNVKRFTARSSREALALVRQAFGDDAVVLSNRPCAEGVEVLAMAPEGMSQIEKVAASAPKSQAPSRLTARPTDNTLAARAARQAPVSFGEEAVQEDVQTLAMSTLSFQDYVRERMLKRRQAELSGRTEPSFELPPAPAFSAPAFAAPASAPADSPEGVASLQAARRQRAQAA